MAEVDNWIVVDRPIGEVYEHWTRFENFPQFMEGVESVEWTDDSHLHWRVNIDGREREYETVITDHAPERHIAWSSTDESEPSAWDVSFEGVANQTKIYYHVVYEPQNILEKAGDVLGFMSRRTQGDLERFKRLIEEVPEEAVAWQESGRGE